MVAEVQDAAHENTQTYRFKLQYLDRQHSSFPAIPFHLSYYPGLRTSKITAILGQLSSMSPTRTKETSQHPVPIPRNRRSPCLKGRASLSSDMPSCCVAARRRLGCIAALQHSQLCVASLLIFTWSIRVSFEYPITRLRISTSSQYHVFSGCWRHAHHRSANLLTG